MRIRDFAVVDCGRVDYGRTLFEAKTAMGITARFWSERRRERFSKLLLAFSFFFLFPFLIFTG